MLSIGNPVDKKSRFEVGKRSSEDFGSNAKENPSIGNGRIVYLYQKKQIKSEYGLLLIETGYVLLDLKSVTQALKR
jgi:hypothetical protein